MNSHKIQKNYYHLLWFLVKRFDLLRRIDVANAQETVNFIIIVNFLNVYWQILKEKKISSKSKPLCLSLFFLLDRENKVHAMSNELAELLPISKGFDFSDILNKDKEYFEKMPSHYRYIEFDLVDKFSNSYKALVLRVSMNNDFDILQGFALPFNEIQSAFPINSHLYNASNGFENSIIQAHDTVLCIDNATDFDINQKYPTPVEIANKVGLTLNQLQIGYRKIYNTNFLSFYNENKNIYAFYFIVSSTLSLKEIAFKCNYNDYNTFYKSFKKQFDLSPSEVRERQVK
ncbi:helix-turn-helix domain-containing protein [Myroides sp. LoEW2-1]|uniref:helix-turn-helix domain-containing protein n=1 Tax=Myroides sp. LoEW2-1 TaxID=2683192 RepID=UPI00132A79B3|nr:helix-turn-helix domain-containing protein [Myroides sp. LoEW2-1]MVX34414.1 helix-turn-helix domain-containing protein [Myroides sp. LoEW2-1]